MRKTIKKTIRKNRNKNMTAKNRIIGGAFPEYLGNDPTKGKTLVYFVFGLGCDELQLDEEKKIFSRNTRIDKSNIILLCHKNSSAIKSIGKTYFNLCPLYDSNFINKFKDSIINNVKDYDKILVYGHSFGGAIVNRVAEELNKEKDKSFYDKIYMAAFGSIYIPQAMSKQEGINIINYLARGDVVRKCGNDYAKIIDNWEIDNFKIIKKIKVVNETIRCNVSYIPISYNKIENSNIYGINFCETDSCDKLIDIKELNMQTGLQKYIQTGKKKHILSGIGESIFGSKTQWYNHTRYFDLVYEFIKQKTNDIDDFYKINDKIIPYTDNILPETDRKLSITNSLPDLDKQT
jgi:hypothetical protein